MTRVCACGCGTVLPANARSDQQYVDATHRGRGHRADGAGGDQASEQGPKHSELERLVRAELAEVERLDTSAGRVLVLAARRVEATDGASDAMRQYWAARADALGSVTPEPDSVTPEGGDDEPKRPAGSTASTLTLVS